MHAARAARAVGVCQFTLRWGVRILIFDDPAELARGAPTSRSQFCSAQLDISSTVILVAAKSMHSARTERLRGIS